MLSDALALSAADPGSGPTLLMQEIFRRKPFPVNMPCSTVTVCVPIGEARMSWEWMPAAPTLVPRSSLSTVLSLVVAVVLAPILTPAPIRPTL
ncbi:hypothetical protein GCM10023195_26910 [Actinoallomurus liliacearum]|uniref:Uncharacterized protein n=1 Tax=Actinoallomurus liliacearum TaxID=1080073 RepID=A0ABP8TI76_9ACTN